MIAPCSLGAPPTAIRGKLDTACSGGSGKVEQKQFCPRRAAARRPGRASVRIPAEPILGHLPLSRRASNEPIAASTRLASETRLNSLTM